MRTEPPISQGSQLDAIHRVRGAVMPALACLTLASAVLVAWASPWFSPGLALFGGLYLLGLHDLRQTRHSLLRNFPVLGHLRFLLESTGPEFHQYVVESNTSGRPFSRDERALIYRRSKGIEAVKPFGTELDVYAGGYTFLSHSIVPKPVVANAAEQLRVDVGGADCTKPYSASIINISAMSFGSLGSRAILALNLAARKGSFAHNTGEGGISRYHREGGGDLIWQIGTGYFGCRDDRGRFDPDRFADTAALDAVRMIELKISQGAKPGHGGILPSAKVTPEIAEARAVEIGRDCVSPPGHSAFSTPTGLCELVARLRELAGGKPVGFKLCIGDPREWFAIAKAIVATGIAPDFITVDGGEGGTGAAPIEFSNHLGMPLREGLMLVSNTLVGIDRRDRIRIAASGRRSASQAIAEAMALGADWCNIGRGFMFSLGCIQAQRCHTNTCPVGVATQNERLQRALVVDEKAQRALNFHRNTVQALAEVTAACGLEHPTQFTPLHLYQRLDPHEVRRFDQIFDFFAPGQLLAGDAGTALQPFWDAARADSFALA